MSSSMVADRGNAAAAAPCFEQQVMGELHDSKSQVDRLEGLYRELAQSQQTIMQEIQARGTEAQMLPEIYEAVKELAVWTVTTKGEIDETKNAFEDAARKREEETLAIVNEMRSM